MIQKKLSNFIVHWRKCGYTEFETAFVFHFVIKCVNGKSEKGGWTEQMFAVGVYFTERERGIEYNSLRGFPLALSKETK